MTEDSYNRDQILEAARALDEALDGGMYILNADRTPSDWAVKMRRRTLRNYYIADCIRGLIFVSPFIILMWVLALSVPA